MIAFCFAIGLSDPAMELNVAVVSNNGTSSGPSVEEAGVIDVTDISISVAPPAELSKWFVWRQNGTALVKYLLDSEVHTFAFSVAANAILSFIPFVVLLYTIAFSVFHSRAMADVVSDMIGYFFPSDHDFIARNLALAAPHHGIQILSLVLILISCTGIFLPLEVALNQAWGVTKSRNYITNQIVSLGLAIWMVVLGMTTIILSAGQRKILDVVFFHHIDGWFLGALYNGISEAWLALCGCIASILFFFSIYWLLPNCKVPWRPVFRASVVVGLIWLAAKSIFVWFLPHMDLKALYGPFYISVGLLFWAYASGLILFAGAQYSVRVHGKGPATECKE